MLRALLRYEPETGKLFWRPRPREMFATERAFKRFATVFADREAFTATNSGGYRQGYACYQHFTAHRVIWAIQNGEWPNLSIDHINGDCTDNRMANLRMVTVRDNQRNRKLPRNNTTGAIGVRHRERRWQATISINGRTQTVGWFASMQDAAYARKEAERAFGYHPNHGRAATTGG